MYITCTLHITCNLAQVEVQSTLNTDVWGMRSASVYLQGFKQEFTKGSVSSHKFKLFNKKMYKYNKYEVLGEMQSCRETGLWRL